MILKDIWMDVKAVQERDPAARNALEVLLLYQGVHALIWHRVAHWFYEHHMFFIARLISQVARFFTLIEIHPGAQLGHGILIDHGCGVVIGETAVVGDNCTIYQGVTLGGVGTQKGKRHPTLGNNVTVGSGAKILGSFEVGDNCSVAANAVLLRPLEENTTAVGIPARPVKKDGVALPKKQKMIIGEDDQRILEQIDALRKELQELREESANLRKELEAVRAGQEKALHKIIHNTPFGCINFFERNACGLERGVFYDRADQKRDTYESAEGDSGVVADAG